MVAKYNSDSRAVGLWRAGHENIPCVGRTPATLMPRVKTSEVKGVGCYTYKTVVVISVYQRRRGILSSAPDLWSIAIVDLITTLKILSF